jgi:hypothetical protein
MHTAYVTLYTWDWQPVGQVSIDLNRLERNGKIDRSELDDVALKASRPLLKGKGITHVHIFIHEGDPATPEELLQSAKDEHATNGPDAESWGRNRRVKRPGPIDRKLLKKQDLK